MKLTDSLADLIPVRLTKGSFDFGFFSDKVFEILPAASGRQVLNNNAIIWQCSVRSASYW